MSCVSIPSCEGAGGGGGFERGRFSEDEEFDECADEDHDGQLTEEKTLCEGETGQVSRQ